MELQIFQNAEFGSVRSIMIGGEPFFVGKDVAEILGYADPNKAIAMHVDEYDKLNDKTASSLGQRGGWLINESGLYSLILSSKLPAAKRFKRWVTSEVLPTIRRHGLYAVDDMLNNPDALIEALQAYKAERMQRMALEAENAVQKQQLIEMQPKASYYDVILNSPDLVSITEISKDYGWSARKLNEYLHRQGVQFKQGGRIWILYQKYAEKGYTSTKTHTFPATGGSIHTKVHTYWTQKGRFFIYDLLKADGILPLIEQEDDALQREIIETENELKRLEEQAKQSATALQKISATGEKLKDVGSNIEGAGKKLLPVTATVTAPGTASVKTAADFEAAMSKVAAVSGATGSDLEALTKKAREMGSKTKFSASEAAEAMNYMAMAGWKTEDMLSGIRIYGSVYSGKWLW